MIASIASRCLLPVVVCAAAFLTTKEAEAGNYTLVCYAEAYKAAPFQAKFKQYQYQGGPEVLSGTAAMSVIYYPPPNDTTYYHHRAMNVPLITGVWTVIEYQYQSGGNWYTVTTWSGYTQ